MKLLKKMSALLVTVVMMAVTVVPAFAANVSIDTTDNLDGFDSRIFKAYQIFKSEYDALEGKSENQQGNTTEVLSDVEWGSAFKNENGAVIEIAVERLASKLNLKDVSTEGKIDAKKVAKALDNKTEAEGNEIAKIIYNVLFVDGKGEDTYKAPKPAGITLNKGENNIIDNGYYLIVDQTQNGSVNPAVLQVVGDITIKPKTEDVPLKKTVLDSENGADGTYDDSADYNIGEDVPFRLAAKVPDMTHYDTYKFQFADTLSTGLTLNSESIKVYVADDEEGTNKSVITLDNYEVNSNPGSVSLEGGSPNTITPSFTVTLNDLKSIKNVGAQDWIIVEYTARLNENAEFKNDNKVQLIYSNNPNTGGNGHTDEQKVYVFTFTLDGTKVDGVNKITTLEGAEFAITRTVPVGENTTKVQYRAKNVQGKIEWKDLEGNDIKNVTDAEKFISAEDTGKFTINGLDAGDYDLWEIKAPAGYNTPNKSFKIKIEADHNKDEVTKLALKIDGTLIEQEGNNVGTSGSLIFNIENNKGTTLPETGGMGTTMLYVAGGILLIGSAVLLVTKKRMGHEN